MNDHGSGRRKWKDVIKAQQKPRAWDPSIRLTPPEASKRVGNRGLEVRTVLDALSHLTPHV